MEDIKTVALPERVIDQLLQSAGVSAYHPDGSQQEKLYAFAHAVAEEVQYRLPRAELQKDAEQPEPAAYLHRFEKGTALSFFGESSDNTGRPDWIGCIPLYAAPQPKAATVPQGLAADQLLEMIDTLLAHVNEAHAAKSKEWAKANFQAADTALQKITEMVKARAAPSLPAQSEGEQK